MKTLIYHHLGLGDHIVCNAIVRHLYEKYGPLSLFVKKHNFASVRALYKDIEVNLIQVNNDRDCYIFFKDFNVIKIGFEKTVFPNWEKSFYDQLEIDYSLRFSKFYIERDYEREALLEQKLKLPDEFAFCNTSYSEGNAPLSIQSYLPKIYLSKITDNIFDWIGVLEKAAELHTIDSSVFHLIKQLNLNSKKYFYDIRSMAPSRTKQLPINWFIINI